MQQDLERRIKHEEESFAKSIPEHSNLIELSKECLSTKVDQRIIHAILDIGHLKNVSRYIANENLTDMVRYLVDADKKIKLSYWIYVRSKIKSLW